MATDGNAEPPVPPTKEFHPMDPFGLMGSDLQKQPIKVDEIPQWLDEMRSILEERWRVVEEHYRSGRLAAALARHPGPMPTPTETRYWYEDAKQDHAWRVRLLNRRTSEGKMYFAYLGICCENGFFYPDPSQGEPLRRVILHLLDLESPPRPFDPPHLKLAVFTKDRWAKSRRDGKLYPFPMEGVEIPRRYSRARARRLAAGFVTARSTEYWAEVQDQLSALIERLMQQYSKVESLGLLEQAVGEPAARLMRAVSDPQLKLAKTERTRVTTLTPSERQRAARLYRKLYPQVVRCVRAMRARGQPEGIPEDIRRRVRMARAHEQLPQRVTLFLIRDQLKLSIGLDTLRRKIGPLRAKGARR